MTWKQTMSVLPGIGTSLLPKVICPACWPAYAGMLSALGLGFVPLSTKFLLPLTLLFLVVAVAALGFRARQRRGYFPMLLGVFASAEVIGGKFVFGSNPFMYSGLAALIAASIWNIWPQQKRSCCVETSQQAGKGGTL